MTTRNFENMDESVETMTKAAQDSTRIVTDYVVQAQELNTRFAQRAFETWTDASRRHTKLGQTTMQRLIGNVEEQSDAVRNLYGQWVSMHWGFPFFGLSVLQHVVRPAFLSEAGYEARGDGHQDCANGHGDYGQEYRNDHRRER
jgi:hypothetical protein